MRSTSDQPSLTMSSGEWCRIHVILQPYAWAPSSPLIHRSATGMRSRHQVLQDSISHVRPLEKNPWHCVARSATSAKPRRGAIVCRAAEEPRVAVLRRRVLRRVRALRYARAGCPLTPSALHALVDARDVEIPRKNPVKSELASRKDTSRDSFARRRRTPRFCIVEVSQRWHLSPSIAAATRGTAVAAAVAKHASRHASRLYG